MSLAPAADPGASPTPVDRTPEARSPTPLIEGRGLTRRYGERAVLEVDEIALHAGELLAVLGPNGAGKSTLLRILSMLEPPASGEVTFRGLRGTSAEAALRRASSVVFQRSYLWRDSVAYNVGLGLRLRHVPRIEVERRVTRVCEALGIAGLLPVSVETLSEGETRRVAVARSLVLEPEILFLDEPTAGLDAESRLGFRADLERIARRRTSAILLITHDRNEAFRLADRVAVLRDGRIVQIGTPTELYQSPADPYVARMTGAELTIRGRVVEMDGRLLTVDSHGIRLSAVGDAEPGSAVRIAYRPEDLVLAPAGDPGGGSSVRNRLYSTIRERCDMDGLTRLRLDGPPELVALVTRSAAEELGLGEGVRVSVRVKATALHAYPAVLRIDQPPLPVQMTTAPQRPTEPPNSAGTSDAPR